MAVISAYMVPHPPMIVPAVGRGDEARVRATTESYDKVAQEIASLKPETIVVISPHSDLRRPSTQAGEKRKACPEDLRLPVRMIKMLILPCWQNS